MKCAPVLIVTLNRYSHLRRCIESLQRNKLAKDTDLYIGLDYPPGQEYEAGYEQVLNYLNGGIDGFHEVVIVKQSVNMGILKLYRMLLMRSTIDIFIQKTTMNFRQIFWNI